MPSTTPSRRELRHGFRLLWLVLIALSTAHGGALAGKDLLTALQRGGYVILMRHASSPQTLPEPAQLDPDNVQHERQLDASGQAAARAMGEALRRLQIPVGQVLSSPTYRALQTVKFAGLGTATSFPELGDSGHSMAVDTSWQRAAWLRVQTAQPPLPGKNTFIVTHLPNIAEAYGEPGATLADGEALVLRPDARGGAPIIARIKIDEWARLDTLP
jgi:phosphohistidine phosphatase SixA